MAMAVFVGLPDAIMMRRSAILRVPIAHQRSKRVGRNEVAIIGIRAVGSVESGVLAHLIGPIGEAFRRVVRIDEPLEDPDFAYNPGRGQYLAMSILQRLHGVRLADEEKLLGVVDRDLYVPDLNFVFGLADPTAGVALISLTRLRAEFYGQPPNGPLFLDRAVKEALHELGHTYGLRHCPDPDCVMHFSNSIEDTDRKRAVFCPHCA